MVKLSVNVNKIATLRNARGGQVPDLLRGVRCCIAAGAPGITVHPRSDERHIRRQDAIDIARLLADEAPGVEYNIEGDPRPDWIDLVTRLRPTQATLVPVRPGEVTSGAAWQTTPADEAALRDVVARLAAAGIRVSVFVDPSVAAVRWAAALGAQRVELFTQPYADAFARDPQAAVRDYLEAARCADRLGLGVNGGHDLSLTNLRFFATAMPRLDEVSIGHALVSDALFMGLGAAIRAYLACLQPAADSARD